MCTTGQSGLKGMLIHQAGAVTGLTIDTIRYYERQHLLDERGRVQHDRVLRPGGQQLPMRHGARREQRLH